MNPNHQTSIIRSHNLAAICTLECAHAPDPQPFSTPFHVIAHRGASAYAPENTLPAFAIARELGAYEVEIDVVLSSDDVVMLFHDTKMDEKTNRTGVARDYTAQELRDTDIGSWFDRTHPEVEKKYAGTPLIALSELFDAMGRDLYYHVEIKSHESDLPRRTLQVIDAYGLRDRVMITSFSLEQLQRVRALDLRVPIGHLIAGDFVAGVDRAVAEGFNQVGIPVRSLTPEIVAYGHSRGLEVRAWWISSDADMDRAIALGANGMTSNWPDRLIARLVELMGAR